MSVDNFEHATEVDRQALLYRQAYIASQCRVLFKVLYLLVWVYAGLKESTGRKRNKFYTTYVNIEMIPCLVFEKIVFISDQI